ncbi:helicase associated domain-containing protein [Streptomyces sp. S1D4-11]|nr:helicase associated domain-containing protein [Streptomyces sp. S1D4-11]
MRAHDTETIEALADPRVRNSRPEAEQEGAEGEFEGEEDGREGAARVSGAAAGVLRFSEERDPFALTQFVRLRIIDPEGAYWRRGIEAATRWLRETGKTELRVPYVFVAPEEWGTVGGYPLGRWLADVRRYYAAGSLEGKRVTELEALGMVWSAWDTAWADGLAVAKDYAAVHGHFLPPTNAVWGGDRMAIGVWAKNQRAVARKTHESAVRRAAGESGVSSAGELSESRLEALDAIDPAWCPAWGIDWQRGFHLTLMHVRSGGALPVRAGEVLVQGEDLGAWTTAQRVGWDKLTPAQQWMLDSVLGLEPAGEAEQPPARRTQADRWATHLAAARQFHAREGHLNVPRKHVEDVGGVPVKLGGFLDNTRRRASKLTPERHAELDALGMRW